VFGTHIGFFLGWNFVAFVHWNKSWCFFFFFLLRKWEGVKMTAHLFLVLFLWAFFSVTSISCFFSLPGYFLGRGEWIWVRRSSALFTGEKGGDRWLQPTLPLRSVSAAQLSHLSNPVISVWLNSPTLWALHDLQNNRLLDYIKFKGKGPSRASALLFPDHRCPVIWESFKC